MKWEGLVLSLYHDWNSWNSNAQTFHLLNVGISIDNMLAWGMERLADRYFSLVEMQGISVVKNAISKCCAWNPGIPRNSSRDISSKVKK
jgi:hypothetical protein